MTAITTAVRLLREAATELKKSHTLNGDWGNEHDALTAYNEHIAAAADLERIAPQCLAQIQEPATPGTLVKAIREYLGVHEVSGRMDVCAVDDMALELARIALGIGVAPATVAPQDFEAWAEAEGLTTTIYGIRGEHRMLAGFRKAWEAGRRQQAAVAGHAISDKDRLTLAGALGLLRGHRYNGSADALQRVLDAAAPALEAPATPECERCGLSPEEHNLTHWCDNQSFRHEDGTVQLGVTEQPLAAAPQAPAAPVYPAKFGPDDWIMVVAGIPVKRDEWSPGAVKARTIYGTSAVSTVDASDTALLDAMERHRIALVPEFEGPWDAELYEEGEEPQHIGSGATPREALRAALVTHLQGSGAAISTVRENSAWPMPIPAAQAKKGGA